MTELELKAAVRERDGNRCTRCSMTADDHIATFGYRLHVHRTVPGSSYTVEGCVTLCHKCHGIVHRKPHRDNPFMCVRLDASLVETCRHIAEIKQRPLQAVISDLLRSPIVKEYERAKRQLLNE